MKIMLITPEIYHEIEEFLKHIPSVDQINPEVIEKSIILWDEEKIKGIISYECFGKYGLIRYFIFQKDIEIEWVKGLFDTMIEKAKGEDLKAILSLVQREELLIVFKSLGFQKIPTSSFYLNEVPLLETNFSEALVMMYEIT